MTNHFNGLSESEAERLAILIEECGEVVQAACKTLRHGYESANPKAAIGRQGETNREALERELGDLSHAVNRMGDADDINQSAIASRAESKPQHILPFLHHQGVLPTIHRELDGAPRKSCNRHDDCEDADNGAPVPDIKACDHLKRVTFTSLPIKEHPACADCGTHICSDCQDDAVHCHSHGSTCLGIICEDCLDTARKRDIKRPMFDGKRNAQIPTTDYLCAPCCAKQDAARFALAGPALLALDDIGTASVWLDDIVDQLEAALQKAKEAL
jgi:hypothetical protein